MAGCQLVVTQNKRGRIVLNSHPCAAQILQIKLNVAVLDAWWVLRLKFTLEFSFIIVGQFFEKNFFRQELQEMAGVTRDEINDSRFRVGQF